jgi:hypothetical protein
MITPPFIHPAQLRNVLVIDTSDGPRPLRECIDPWQRTDFEACDPMFLVAMGKEPAAPETQMRALLKRPRGHSKTTDAAIMALSAIAGAQRQITGVAIAAAKDQAAFVRDHIERTVGLTEPLRREVTDPRDGRRKPLIEVQQYCVRNSITGSSLDVLSADVASSWGINCNFVVLDEVCHWPDGRGEELWHTTLSSANKRKDCALLIGTNAFLGAGHSWQWKILDAARRLGGWYTSELPGSIASWYTQKQLDEQAELLPPKARARLVDNQDIAESGDSIEWADIQAAIRGIGPHPVPVCDAYCASIDIGLKRDRSAITVLGVDSLRGELHLAEVLAWNPADYGGEIPLELVEEAIWKLHDRLYLNAVVFDPWQCALLAQRLRNGGLKTIEWSPTAKNLDLAATSTLSAFRNRQIVLYPQAEELIDDLRKIQIIERPTGFRLQAARNKQGHSDRASALCQSIDVCLRSMVAIANEIVFSNTQPQYISP